MIEMVRAIIVSAALAHSAHAGFMLDLARCESGGNPSAENGPNKGLYQLSLNGKAREFFALGYGDLYDASQQADYVAGRVAVGDVWAWTCTRLVPRPAAFFAPGQDASLFLPANGTSVPAEEHDSVIDMAGG